MIGPATGTGLILCGRQVSLRNPLQILGAIVLEQLPRTLRVLGWNLEPDPPYRLGDEPVDADVVNAQQRGLDSIRFQA